MELLDASSQQDKALSPGIYVIDDDGIGVMAGPFPNEDEALQWIERTAPQRIAAARHFRPR
jgi:hypothetical protein